MRFALQRLRVKGENIFKYQFQVNWVHIELVIILKRGYQEPPVKNSNQVKNVEYNRVVSVKFKFIY